MGGKDSKRSAASINQAAITKAKKAKKAKKAPPTFTVGPAILVTFLIGPADQPTTYLVSKEFACAASPVFEVAFNSNFVEGQTQTYKLEDTTPCAFRFLLQWIYSEKLTIIFEQDEETQRAMQATEPPYYDRGLIVDGSFASVELQALAEAWILADKLIIPKLQNAVMNKLYFIAMKKGFPTGCFNYVYANTQDGSPLRKILINFIAQLVQDGFIKKSSKAFPHQLLIDVIDFRERYGYPKPSWRIPEVNEYYILGDSSDEH